jgi:hypothetical protein
VAKYCVSNRRGAGALKWILGSGEVIGIWDGRERYRIER